MQAILYYSYETYEYQILPHLLLTNNKFIIINIYLKTGIQKYEKFNQQ